MQLRPDQRELGALRIGIGRVRSAGGQQPRQIRRQRPLREPGGVMRGVGHIRPRLGQPALGLPRRRATATGRGRCHRNRPERGVEQRIGAGVEPGKHRRQPCSELLEQPGAQIARQRIGIE
ncbi:hypothetical protein ABE532_09760 [Luteimonas sp. TWI165]|uniref:hypothetical protein n=1 Tax=Luteimonas sp. TWI165 TaxID=3136772 RepID=UPI00320980BC